MKVNELDVDDFFEYIKSLAVSSMYKSYMVIFEEKILFELDDEDNNKIKEII